MASDFSVTWQFLSKRTLVSLDLHNALMTYNIGSNENSLWCQVNVGDFVLGPVQVGLQVALNPTLRLWRVPEVELQQVVVLWNGRRSRF
jgi:hypothetical protein